jgi:hypothetical protein
VGFVLALYSVHEIPLGRCIGVAEVHCLRQLGDENRRLKALVADLTPEKYMLQEVKRKSCKADPETPISSGVSNGRLQTINVESLPC